MAKRLSKRASKPASKPVTKPAKSAQTPEVLQQRLAQLAAELPEAQGTQQGDHTCWRVRTKTFGYFLNNHHGDGRLALVVKTEPGEHEFLVLSEPESFFRPAYLAKSGWVSLALDRGAVDWQRVRLLLRNSYRRQAPRSLVAQLRD